ncbi:MAG: S41 family peptidase [bacterium]|nr:peptidase S41 [Gammaproteobacteria bacterium]HIL97059.1 peptidase S41 [Pseudomonadales bacterium]
MKPQSVFIVALCSLVLWAFSAAPAAASAGFFRSADIHGDELVFTAEGDLWVANIPDGDGRFTARRLTTHPAEEKEAAISPDEKQVAYAANYEGVTEVYLIPLTGGVAKRLSFENGRVRVHGWTPDSKVLYSVNNRIGLPGNWTLRTVDPDSLVAESIPLADAVEGAVDEKNKTVYFVQFGLQISGDNTRIYRGGAKGELWRYRLGSNKEAVKLTTNHVGSARRPMVYKKTLYFISDASGNDNIWSMDLDGSDVKQVTTAEDWSVRSANLDGGRIVFQLGADLHLLDLASGESRLLEIDLTSDFSGLRERWINKPLKYTTSTRLAGDHEKVVITARGKVAIAGIDKSRLVEVSTRNDSRTRKAVLSHDGRWVFGFSDASGEMEIWRFAADGSTQREQLTVDGSTFRRNLVLSPDGNWIVHDDYNGDLWLLDTRKLENRKIVSDGAGFQPYGRVAWSADSQLLAVPRSYKSDKRSRVLLYSVKEGKYQVVTSDKYNSYSPVFSPDGDWLYFLSDRHFAPSPNSPWGDRNLGPMFDRRTLIFAYGLNAESGFPFQNPNELLMSDGREEGDQEGDEKNEARDEDTDDKEVEVKPVDWQGIPSRLWQVPVESGNYSSLAVNDKFIFVQDRASKPGAKPTIKSIPIEPSPKINTFTDKVVGYSLSDNGKKMFVSKESSDKDDLYIVDAVAKFPADTSKSKVQTKDWQLVSQPGLEWNQMFHDAWIMHRDSFFDPDMRGLDWQKVKEKYQPLLSRITDRYELNDVFAQMMGELNALHSQVRGGDVPKDDARPKASTLGAVLNQTSQGVVITHLYQHDPELPSQASPLMKPGVDAREGDIIKAINGIETKTLAAVNQLLRNQAGKQVLVELNRGESQIKTIVVPATARDDFRLRYGHWANSNRIKVEAADAQLGYLHLRAMGPNDVASFARDFYASFTKDGIIIDVRRNNGGNVDSWIINTLLRRAWMFWQPRLGEPSANMQQVFRGHFVVLADERTYSDGETFTAAVKALKLAPVIGKQTAGAGVWLTGRNRLVDNGVARVAELPVYAMDGRWAIEGHGVAPDIEVNNLPHATFNGGDAQLDAAIEYLKDKISKEPIPPMKAKPFTQNGVPANDIN